MSKINEIRQQITDEYETLKEQQAESKAARQVWGQSLQAERDTEKRIKELRQQLLEEKQRAFDEDGTLIREWM